MEDLRAENTEPTLWQRFCVWADFVPPVNAGRYALEFHARLVELLFRSSRPSPIGNLIIGALALVALWSMVPREILVGWYSALLLTCISRQLVIARYFRLSHSQHETTQLTKWLLLYTCVTGCLWGLFPILLFEHSVLTARLFQAVMIVGVSAAAVTSLAAMRGSTVSFLVPAMSSMMIVFGLAGTFIDWVTCCTGLTYLGFLLKTAFASRQTLHDTIRLNLRNEELVFDLSEQKQKLDSALGHAEAASRLKTEFLANMSHEVRTPLNGVMGMIELAKEISKSDDQREYLGEAYRSAERLLSVLNDVLDVSKIESGKLELSEDEFPLADEVERVKTLFGAVARDSKVTLSAELSPRLPQKVIGDPLRFSQVLSNLIGNAIKFTKEGGAVHVSVNCLRETEKKLLLEVHVADSGIGIPKSQQSSVFEAFTQVDSSVTRTYGGTGLGLSICSKLVDLMGGELSVWSEEGKGSIFSFTFVVRPREVSANRKAQELVDEEAEDTNRYKILLAEDNELNAKLATIILQRMGHEVTLATNGQEALNSLDAETFDLVLMDCQMPILDGYQTTQAIRHDRGLSIPIVALTAHAFDEERQKCLSIGMDEFVTKPIRKAELSDVIQRVMRDSSQQD